MSEGRANQKRVERQLIGSLSLRGYTEGIDHEARR